MKKQQMGIMLYGGAQQIKILPKELVQACKDYGTIGHWQVLYLGPGDNVRARIREHLGAAEHISHYLPIQCPELALMIDEATRERAAWFRTARSTHDILAPIAYTHGRCMLRALNEYCIQTGASYGKAVSMLREYASRNNRLNFDYTGREVDNLILSTFLPVHI